MDFTTENEAFAKELVNQLAQETLQEVKDDCVELFKQSISDKVYSAYTPVEYQRTYQLLNNVNSHINKDNELYIFSDMTYENYHSAVDGSDVSNFVAGWIEDGHDSNSLTINEYEHYKPREYLEEAKQLIDNSLGTDCTIIKNGEEE
jgi:hypothetical protein